MTINKVVINQFSALVGDAEGAAGRAVSDVEDGRRVRAHRGRAAGGITAAGAAQSPSECGELLLSSRLLN